MKNLYKKFQTYRCTKFWG